MPLDLFAIGPPGGGLFMFGKRFLPRPGAGEAQDESVEPPSTRDARGTTRRGFNPYAEALRTELALERGLRVIGTLQLPEPYRGLGAHIDLRA